MSDKDQEQAKEFADRARTQAGHAARNAARAVKSESSAIADGVEHVSGEVVDDAKEAASRFSRFNSSELISITADTSLGFAALTLSIASGAYALKVFKGVFAARGQGA